MAAITFSSNAIKVPADVALERIYVDMHDEVNNTPVHMVRLDLSEDQAVELATLLLLGATTLRGARLEAEEIARVEAAERVLRPCYCDTVYHAQGC